MITKGHEQDNDIGNMTSSEISGTILSVGALAGLAHLAYRNNDLMSRAFKKIHNKLAVDAATKQYFKMHRPDFEAPINLSEDDFMFDYTDVIESDIHHVVESNDVGIDYDRIKINRLISNIEIHGRAGGMSRLYYNMLTSYIYNWDIARDGQIPDILRTNTYSDVYDLEYETIARNLMDTSKDFRSKFISRLKSHIKRKNAINNGIVPHNIETRPIYDNGKIIDYYSYNDVHGYNEDLKAQIKESTQDLRERGIKIIQPSKINDLVTMRNSTDITFADKQFLNKPHFIKYRSEIKNIITGLRDISIQSNNKIHNIQVSEVITGVGRNMETRIRVSYDVEGTSKHVTRSSFDIPIQHVKTGHIPNQAGYGGAKRISKQFYTENPFITDSFAPVRLERDSTKIMLGRIATMLSSSGKNILIESENGELFAQRIEKQIGNIVSRLTTTNNELRQAFHSYAVQSEEAASLQLMSDKTKTNFIEDLRSGSNSLRIIKNSFGKNNTAIITLDLETINTHVDSPSLATTSAHTDIWQSGITVTDSTGLKASVVEQTHSSYILKNNEHIRKVLQMNGNSVEIQKYIDTHSTFKSFVQYMKKVTGKSNEVDATLQFCQTIKNKGNSSNITSTKQMADNIISDLKSKIAGLRAQNKKVILSTYNGARFDLQILATSAHMSINDLLYKIGINLNEDVVDMYQATKAMEFGSNQGAQSLEAVVNRYVLDKKNLKQIDKYKIIKRKIGKDVWKQLVKAIGGTIDPTQMLEHNNAAYDVLNTTLVFHALGSKLMGITDATFDRHQEYIKDYTSSDPKHIINKFKNASAREFIITKLGKDGKWTDVLSKAAFGGLSSNQTENLVMSLLHVGALDTFLANNPANKEMHQVFRNIWLDRNGLTENMLTSPLINRNYKSIVKDFAPGSMKRFTESQTLDMIFTMNREGSKSGTAVFTSDVFSPTGFSTRTINMKDIKNTQGQHQVIQKLHVLTVERAKALAGAGEITADIWKQASKEILAVNKHRFKKAGLTLRNDGQSFESKYTFDVIGLGDSLNYDNLSIDIRLHENIYKGQVAHNIYGRKILGDRLPIASGELTPRLLEHGISGGVNAQEQFEFLSSGYRGSMQKMLIAKPITILQRKIKHASASDRPALIQQLKELADHYNKYAPDLNFKYDSKTHGLIYGQNNIHLTNEEAMNSIGKLDFKVLMDGLKISGNEAVFNYDTISSYYNISTGREKSTKFTLESYNESRTNLKGYVAHLHGEIDKTISKPDNDMLRRLPGVADDNKFISEFADPLRFVEEWYDKHEKAKYKKSFGEIFVNDRSLASQIINNARVPIFIQALPDIAVTNGTQIGIWAPGTISTAYGAHSGHDVRRSTTALSRTWKDQIAASPQLQFDWIKNLYNSNIGANRTKKASDAYKRLNKFNRMFTDSAVADNMMHVTPGEFDKTFGSIINHPNSKRILTEQVLAVVNSGGNIPLFDMTPLQFISYLKAEGMDPAIADAGLKDTTFLSKNLKFKQIIDKKLSTRIHVEDVVDRLNMFKGNRIMSIGFNEPISVDFNTIMTRHNLDKTNIEELLKNSKMGCMKLEDGHIKMSAALLLPFTGVSQYINNTGDNNFGTYSSSLRAEESLLLDINNLNKADPLNKQAHAETVVASWFKYIDKTMNLTKVGREHGAMHKTAVPSMQFLYRSNERLLTKIDSTLEDLKSGVISDEVSRLLNTYDFNKSMISMYGTKNYDSTKALITYLENIKKTTSGNTMVANADALFSRHLDPTMIRSFNTHTAGDVSLQDVFAGVGINYTDGEFKYSNGVQVKDAKLKEQLEKISRGELTLPGALMIRHPHIQSGINAGTSHDLMIVNSAVSNFLGINKDVIYAHELYGDMQKADSDKDLVQIIMRGFKSISEMDEVRKDTKLSNTALVEKNIFFKEAMKMYNNANYVRSTFVRDGVQYANVSQINPSGNYYNKEMRYDESFFGIEFDKDGKASFKRTGKTSALLNLSAADGLARSVVGHSSEAMEKALSDDLVGAVGKNMIGILTNSVRTRIHDLHLMNPGLKQNIDLLMGFVGDLDHGLSAITQSSISGLKHSGLDDIYKLTDFLDAFRAPDKITMDKYKDMESFWIDKSVHVKDTYGKPTAESISAKKVEFNTLMSRMVGFAEAKEKNPLWAKFVTTQFDTSAGKSSHTVYKEANYQRIIDDGCDKLEQTIRGSFDKLNQSQMGLNPDINNSTYNQSDTLYSDFAERYGKFEDNKIVRGLKKNKKIAAGLGAVYLGLNFFRPMQMSNSMNPLDGFIDLGSNLDSHSKLAMSDLELDRSIPLDSVNASFSKAAFIEMLDYNPHVYKKAKAVNMKNVLSSVNRNINYGSHTFKANPDDKISYTVLTSNSSVFNHSNLDRRLRLVNQGVE